MADTVLVELPWSMRRLETQLTLVGQGVEFSYDTSRRYFVLL